MTALKTRAAAAGTADADRFYSWTQERGARLRTGDDSGLDRENLAAEIESTGGSQFASLVSASRAVLLHMLKIDHQPSEWARSWSISIATHRVHIGDALKECPGLKSRLVEAIGKAYRLARLEAAQETGLALGGFPQTCPYTYQDIMDRTFAIDPEP
ncbi:protein of unknown function DUF29 [Methylobacterium phyllostachyos]|uniref:DUF29 domain-containing protein n=1 Tax=Methylobacterium phyllostachyos TaxID=582672 RepID=A0A1G9TVH0_9HYPH|nr:DUF29 domain-containing protein [Methylobacterium phyllostachyos]SDM51716.1 protein of unknown function DUF29 [Methylobacterium phyllostachyos]